MEVLRVSEEEANKSPTKLLVWNNLAFENGSAGSAGGLLRKPSPTSMAGYSLIKENVSPCVDGSTLCSLISSQDRPPLRPNFAVENQSENETGKSFVTASIDSQEPRTDSGGGENIDSEIESIEKEIGRLALRLEYLRHEKANRITAKTAADKRGRFVPAKFKDPPPPSPSLGKQNPRKIEESVSAKKPVPRSRGMSMAPSEIARGLTPVGRKGISLGPAEIFSATKSRRLASRQETTPVYQSQSRRKSCFWKLQEVDELKVIKERGKCVSLSPKSRKTASKLQAANLKQAATTIGAAKNKSVKKEDSLISSIQPRSLFKDGEKSALAKKPFKCGRVVASRYKSSNGDVNSAVTSSVRKRSLPENDKESKTCERKRISLNGKQESASEIRVKKRWEIPSTNPVSAVKAYEEEEEEEEGNGAEPSSVRQGLSYVDEQEEDRIILQVPRIRTLCRIEESGARDSGAAKRVSELIGRKSYFESEEVEDEISVCQTLNFEEEDDSKEEQLNVSVLEGQGGINE